MIIMAHLLEMSVNNDYELTKRITVFSAYYVPDTVPNAVYELSPLILLVILQGRYHQSCFKEGTAL